MSTKTRKSKGGGGRSTSKKRQKISAAASSPSTISDAPKEWPELQNQKKIVIFKGLLSGHDERIWNSLAHIDPQLFRTAVGKQVVLRAGLRKIGVGWVGTNNTQARIQASYIYNKAKEFYESNGWRRPRGVQEQDTPQKVPVEDIQWAPIQGGEMKFSIISKKSAFTGDITQRIHSTIQETGMVVIRSAVNKPTIEKLISGEGDVNDGRVSDDTEQLVLSQTRTKLTHTSASGLAGEEIYTRTTGGAKNKKEEAIGSFYCDINHSGFLDQLHDVIGHSLKTGQKFHRDQKKYIMLKYSKGGENWAHRDGNSDDNFPYQALLMISSSEDYDGGEFYVASQCPDNGDEGKIIRTCCPKLDAGDLVIFQAHKNGGYDHGMKEVTRGERVAVGLFQPN